MTLDFDLFDSYMHKIGGVPVKLSKHFAEHLKLCFPYAI